MRKFLIAAIMAGSMLPAAAFDLPFEYTFNDEEAFDNDWTSAYGVNAAVNAPWTIKTYSGWAVMDETWDEVEDNWLISKETLNFAEAGNYTVTYTGLIDGKLQVLYGADADNLDSFTLIGEKEISGTWDNDAVYRFSFSLEDAGNYHIAVRACADQGSFAGYRMKSLKVRSDKPVPALVTDLTAMADANDGLTVELSWTNPSLDQFGNALAEITKVELYRNGVLAKDVEQKGVGEKVSMQDVVEASGEYTYYVKTYNANGYSEDAPKEVNAGYVGRPSATLPYKVNGYTEDQMKLLTFHDGNDDGYAYQIVEGSWSKSMRYNAPADTDVDDYVVTPYINLVPGYYEVSYSIDFSGLSLDFGFTFNRKNPATGRILKSFDGSALTGSQDIKEIVIIEEEDEYAFFLHLNGVTENETDLEFKSMSISSLPILPDTATNLTLTEVTNENGTNIAVSWTNPSVDNAGLPLKEDDPLKITIKRNWVEVATFTDENCNPGQDCTWIDENVEEGVYTYTVIVENANGSSDKPNAEANIYIGPATELPYSTVDFAEWARPGYYYNWEYDESTGYTSWANSYAFNFDYSTFSPYFEFKKGREYTLEMIFDGNKGQSQKMNLVTASEAKESSATKFYEFALPEDATDHKVEVTLSMTAAEDAQADEDMADNEEKATIPAGKLMIGVRPGQAGSVTLKSFSISEKANTSAIDNVIKETEMPMSIVTLQGVVLKRNASADDVKALHPGIYIIGGKKVVVR